MSEPADEAVADSALTELLELEERIGEEMTRVRAEAADMLEAARTEAATLERSVALEVSEAEHDLRDRIAREGLERLDEVERRAAREIERHAQVDEVTIRSLGRWLAQRVAGGESLS